MSVLLPVDTKNENTSRIKYLSIIHTIDSLATRNGGPSVSVPNLCHSIQRECPYWDLSVMTSSGTGGESNPLISPLKMHWVPRNDFPQALYSLVRSQSQPCILHDHGQWLRVNHSSAQVSRKTQTARIVSTRGMLNAWATKHRSFRKLIAWWLYAARDLKQAKVIHATSELEASELRARGITLPIAVIPNGVDPTPQCQSDSPESHSRPYVLFMSRIHRVKGVRELIKAWAAMDVGEWELILAGPDEDGSMSGSALPPSVRYVGPVANAEKNHLLRNASLFVLPSYSENFGMVVAESLMAGVPVITTQGTPWESLQTNGCGWWIPMNQESLQAALTEGIQTPRDRLKVMGEKGRLLMIDQFGWDKIAAKMASVYEWMIRSGPVPECIQFLEK